MLDMRLKVCLVTVYDAVLAVQATHAEQLQSLAESSVPASLQSAPLCRTCRSMGRHQRHPESRTGDNEGQRLLLSNKAVKSHLQQSRPVMGYRGADTGILVTLRAQD